MQEHIYRATFMNEFSYLALVFFFILVSKEPKLSLVFWVALPKRKGFKKSFNNIRKALNVSFQVVMSNL